MEEEAGSAAVVAWRPGLSIGTRRRLPWCCGCVGMMGERGACALGWMGSSKILRLTFHRRAASSSLSSLLHTPTSAHPNPTPQASSCPLSTLVTTPTHVSFRPTHSQVSFPLPLSSAHDGRRPLPHLPPCRRRGLVLQLLQRLYRPAPPPTNTRAGRPGHGRQPQQSGMFFFLPPCLRPSCLGIRCPFPHHRLPTPNTPTTHPRPTSAPPACS